MNMGMERWGFLFSVVSSPIVFFLKTIRAVCLNINPIMLCTYVCDVNYAACYKMFRFPSPPTSKGWVGRSDKEIIIIKK